MTKLMILPLVVGHQTATCTICDSDAERAVVTDDSCPVIEALCPACAKAAIEYHGGDSLSWAELADAIREERSGAQEPDDSMDGDHETALASAGLGTDEDYCHDNADGMEVDFFDQ